MERFLQNNVFIVPVKSIRASCKTYFSFFMVIFPRPPLQKTYTMYHLLLTIKGSATKFVEASRISFALKTGLICFAGSLNFTGEGAGINADAPFSSDLMF